MSMYPGYIIPLRLLCPTCGELIPNYQTQLSAFFIIDCANPNCADKGASIVVERQSGIVLSVTRWEWMDSAGQRWRQVYEKVEEPTAEPAIQPKEPA